MADRAKGRYRITGLCRICADAVACVVARCCVSVVFVIQTLALVVGLLIALSLDAINQLPIASVCDTPR